MSIRFGIRLVISLTLGALLAVNAAADDDSDEVKYRKNVMSAMGNQFGAVAMIFTKRVTRPDDLRVNAEALALTSSLTPGLFPEGSQGGEALPLIWEESEKVAAAARKNADSAAALAAAAATGDTKAIAAAFKEAGASCKGCHKRYKQEDD